VLAPAAPPPKISSLFSLFEFQATALMFHHK